MLPNFKWGNQDAVKPYLKNGVQLTGPHSSQQAVLNTLLNAKHVLLFFFFFTFSRGQV